MVGGGSTLSGSCLIDIPNTFGGKFDHAEIVSATGVTAANKISLWIAPHLDDDENHETFLAPVVLSGLAGTNQIAISSTWAYETSGPVRLNWSAV